jgi:hypothetical protein
MGLLLYRAWRARRAYRNKTGAALVDCVNKVIYGPTCVLPTANAANNEGEDSLGARVRDSLMLKEMQILAIMCRLQE